MNNCPNCSAMAAGFAEEVARRNADNQMIACVERFLAECRASSHEFMTVDYVRRKLEDAVAMRGR